jgi:hypothetical protein
MKATKLLLATALFAGLATLSFAGPGPQFWAQQANNAKAQQTKVDAPVKAQPATQIAACANCNCAGMKKS